MCERNTKYLLLLMIIINASPSGSSETKVITFDVSVFSILAY